MSLHPAPPRDLAGLTDAWRHTVQAVIDLGHGCRQGDFERATDCPGWTVKDQISHVVGTELWFATGEVPAVEVPAYGHIRHRMGAMMEKAVELRRWRAGEAIVGELAQVFEMRQTQYDRPGLTLETVVPGPTGRRPLRDVLTLRIMDVWCHEQDIRSALRQPGNLDSAAAAVFMDGLFERVPGLLADADLPLEHAVVIHATGPIEGRVGVRMSRDESGTVVPVELFSGHGHHPHAAEATTTISLTTEALTRRAAGRGGVDDVHYAVNGDAEVARRVMTALPFTP